MSTEEGNELPAFSLDDRIGRINQMFQQYDIQTADVVGKKVEKPLPPPGNYNTRGEITLSPKQVRQNYQNAIYGFKWYQMPLCRRSIKRKLNFWAPASVVLAWTHGEYIKKKDMGKVPISLPPKFYVKSFLFFFGITTIYTFAESLLTEQFCNIQSPFYQQNESRLSIARRIRSQIAGTKDGGFLSSIFG